MEMSRQRLRESSVRWEINLTTESYSLKLLKMIELKSISNKAKEIQALVPPKILEFINENFLDDVKYFEKKNKLKISFSDDSSYNLKDHSIVFLSKSKKIIEKNEVITKLKKIELDKNENQNIKSKKTKFKKRKFYKRKKVK